MSVNIERIKTDFAAFCQRVEAYSQNYLNPSLQKDSCEAAYEGLYKLQQRINKEIRSGNLSNDQLAVCHQIVADNFLVGLLEFRKVGTHIESDTAKKRGFFQIYIPSGQPVEISCEVSAGAAFSNNIFRLPDPSSGITEINHLENLKTAKERIEKKLNKIFNKN